MNPEKTIELNFTTRLRCEVDAVQSGVHIVVTRVAGELIVVADVSATKAKRRLKQKVVEYINSDAKNAPATSHYDLAKACEKIGLTVAEDSEDNERSLLWVNDHHIGTIRGDQEAVIEWHYDDTENDDTEDDD